MFLNVTSTIAYKNEIEHLGRVPNLKKSLYLIKYTSYFLKYEVYS